MATVILKGGVLAVDHLDSTTIHTSGFSAVSFAGNAKTVIQKSSAASTVTETEPGLPDVGQVTFNFYLQMDDPFQQEMLVMYNAQQTRQFTLTFAEGTLNTWTFQAYVVDMPITGAYNDNIKMNLVLAVTGGITRSTV